MRERFTDAELRVSDLRMAGSSWEEVGAELDEPPDRVRKRFERAIKRIGSEIQLESLLDD